MNYDYEDVEENINPDEWIEKVYYEDGIKITRYKPSWWKEGLSKTTFKTRPRKPQFGPKDP